MFSYTFIFIITFWDCLLLKPHRTDSCHWLNIFLPIFHIWAQRIEFTLSYSSIVCFLASSLSLLLSLSPPPLMRVANCWHKPLYHVDFYSFLSLHPKNIYNLQSNFLCVFDLYNYIHEDIRLSGALYYILHLWRESRDWLKDVLRRGVAFAANVVHRRHYTGCVDDGMASWVLVDAAGNSSTVLNTRNTVSFKKFGADGRQCGMPVTLWWTATVGHDTSTDVRLSA